jgi:hypothetical protein
MGRVSYKRVSAFVCVVLGVAGILQFALVEVYDLN